MRAVEQLTFNPAQSWRILQQSKEGLFENLDDLMHRNYQHFLEEVMLYERQQFLNAAPYQRHEARVDQANGFYTRSLVTRNGRFDNLRAPRARSGQFQTQVLERYARRDALVNQLLRQVFLAGVSTRQTGATLAILLDESVSAATVSALCKILEEAVAAWHRRALPDTYRYLILDAVSVRIRLVGKVQRRMVLCAYGITEDGRRELIDFLIVKAESEDRWRAFLEDLWRRGLRGAVLQLITTDGNPGLIAALGIVYPRVSLQRRWAHKLRNVASKLKRSQAECLAQAQLIYQADNRTEAIPRFRAWKARWGRSAERAVRCLEQDLEELLAHFDCPRAHGKKLRTTNVIERLFVEVRRRIRAMCAFTTPGSCERLLYSVFHRINQHWSKHPLKTFTQNN